MQRTVSWVARVVEIGRPGTRRDRGDIREPTYISGLTGGRAARVSAIAALSAHRPREPLARQLCVVVITSSRYLTACRGRCSMMKNYVAKFAGIGIPRASIVKRGPWVQLTHHFQLARHRKLASRPVLIVDEWVRRAFRAHRRARNARPFDPDDIGNGALVLNLLSREMRFADHRDEQYLGCRKVRKASTHCGHPK